MKILLLFIQHCVVLNPYDFLSSDIFVCFSNNIFFNALRKNNSKKRRKLWVWNDKRMSKWWQNVHPRVFVFLVYRKTDLALVKGKRRQDISTVSVLQINLVRNKRWDREKDRKRDAAHLANLMSGQFDIWCLVKLLSQGKLQKWVQMCWAAWQLVWIRFNWTLRKLQSLWTVAV